MVRSE